MEKIETVKCMDCGCDVFVPSATLFNDNMENGETERYLCPKCYEVRIGRTEQNELAGG